MPQVKPPVPTSGKKLLLMRVDFPDLQGETISAADALRLIDVECNDFLMANSRGKLSLSADVSPLMRLPQPSDHYRGNETLLAEDARRLATGQGLRPDRYDYEAFCFPSIGFPWQGFGLIGGRQTWLQGRPDMSTLVHELGHNLGLPHAGRWFADSDSIIGPGRLLPYGDMYDVMGTARTAAGHYNVAFKRYLGWLDESDVVRVSASGTFRLKAADLGPSESPVALRIARGQDREYWVECRAMDGVLVRRAPKEYGPTELLCMGLDETVFCGDASLAIGRTFSDRNAGIHITPVAQEAGVVVVRVNLGMFEDNQPPQVRLTADRMSILPGETVSFTAQASDPDADPLAFDWSIEGETEAAHGNQMTRRFSRAGDYVVRCALSDMKGGRASDAVLIVVGTPTSFRVWGQIPLEGVRVTATRPNMSDPEHFVFSTSDGTYVLTGLTSGLWNISAAKFDYGFRESYTVMVGPDVSGVNFTATLARHSIRVLVHDLLGRPVAGAQVQAGATPALTDVSGNAAISELVNGLYRVTASKDGSTLSPRFENPVEVFGADVDVTFIAQP